MKTLAEIEYAAMQLAEPERATLADHIMASLTSGTEIDRLWLEEAERRLQEVRAGMVETLDADEVMAEMRAL
ncbi:MAG: addiction module protein [Spirochaetales bacterium]|nr:addiction module protein [Spirochaetales bacterium]